MYKDEFWKIVKAQTKHHPVLATSAEALFEIIFFQRPLKLKKDRVGKCSLEPKSTRAKKAWRDYQRFRYLQDINNLAYFEEQTGDWVKLGDKDREKLINLFDKQAKITTTNIKKCLGLSPRGHQLNFEAGTKKFRGDTTTIAIREVMPGWDELSPDSKSRLETDLISYEKKSALKKRLIEHWQFTQESALQLCITEFESEHSELSLKAIRKLLPFLEKGMIYSDARIAAGYGYENITSVVCEKLGRPPQLPNPIVNKGLHELKRVVNAVIKQYGKPSAIRLEMARDLEMNTKRHAAFIKQQTLNERLNQEAQEQYETHVKASGKLGQTKYATRTDRLKYRLWKEQSHQCAYSLRSISLAQLFSSAIEIDHIIPYSVSLNDSYMNKVVCFSSDNQRKGACTPIEAFGETKQWNAIEAAISSWYPKLRAKRDAFYQTLDTYEQSFQSSQLTDTRYISKEALGYLQTLGVDVSTIKGQVTSWLRHIWGMNSLIDANAREKDRADHRHHAIDAAVIACVDRSLYKSIVGSAKQLEKQQSQLRMNDLQIGYRFPDFKKQVQLRLESITIAHATQRKVAGSFHEDTGIGFNDRTGPVYRKDLDAKFTLKNAEKIIDPAVRTLVIEYIEKHNGNSKLAFAPGFFLPHKDGKTPIKRVRVRQSKATLKNMQAKKLAILNKQGIVFKWMTLGNAHHVAIYKKIDSTEYKGDFVSVYHAYQNVMCGLTAFGNKSMKGYEFQYGLHKNDIVTAKSSKDDEQFKFYRLKSIDLSDSRILLEEHTIAKSEKKRNGIFTSVSNLILVHGMQKVEVNAIGQLTYDQADHRSK